MAQVYVEQRAYFECPACGNDSQTSPDATEGRSVVCEHCGTAHRVSETGYMVEDWNARNRKRAKAKK